ncbi:FGGY-family carbohydrate kinase [Streptomyces sp. NPDC050560]|uniref:FGGY-family carbohydrate kinase n=1 Tax=Streptomyces sp. NPDC050560 TaxID=3365630 RepID=UPI0037B9247D
MKPPSAPGLPPSAPGHAGGHVAGADGAVVAVDVGTSAVRAAVLAADGTVLAARRVARPADGGRGFDAEALWGAVAAALGGLEGRRWAPRALAVAAHLGTIAVDARLRPVDEAGGWADPRGLDLLRALPEEIMGPLLAAARRPAPSGGALAYALSLRERPGTRRAVRHLLSPKDFLTARLTGRVTTDRVNAAYTLLSDVAAGRWNEDAVTALGLDPGWLPPQAAGHEVVGTLTGAAARECGLPPGTPVVAGGPDGSVGLGLLLGEGDAVADVAGTTDVVGRLLADPLLAPAGAVVNPALTGGGWTAGGPTGMSGGAVARWRALVGAVPEDELARVPPGADGLLVLPAMSGSRFPRWHPADRGAVLGQGPGHTPAHLLRAAQEGASFTVREAVDLLDPPTSGSAPLPVAMAGGTARSVSAARMRADVLRRTVLVCDQPDVTLLGAAALALIGAALTPDLPTARHRLGCTFHELHPNPAHAAPYDTQYHRWLQARTTLSGLTPPAV